MKSKLAGLLLCVLCPVLTAVAQDTFHYWVPYVDTVHVGASDTWHWLRMDALDDSTLITIHGDTATFFCMRLSPFCSSARNCAKDCTSPRASKSKCTIF
ncbi:hypothetical protein KKH27_08265 [bacterium]|nr:hypothetical protein [bacterium]MBU1984105.1 hypothetical protein [bacterium]